MEKQLLNNRYRMEEHIGSGGMAEVYLAHDQLLDRQVAVKILRPQFSSDEEFITRFRREAKAAARLSNPSIVNIYDVGEDDHRHYIVMEYVAGETLKTAIDRNGKLSAPCALNIAIGIASALEHAHDRGVVHCDIKPHNILLTPDFIPKVADFGIAKAISTTTATTSSTIMGSVHYLSPEQAKGEKLTAQSDLYSLGVVIFEMLTGELPFNGESAVSIALKHVQAKAPSLLEKCPDLPLLLDAVVARLLAKEPADRYPTAAALIQDLRAVLRRLNTSADLNDDETQTRLLPKITDYEQTDETATIQTPPYVQKATSKPVEKVGKKNKKVFMLTIAALLAVGFLLGLFFSYGKFWSGKEVKVPNVVGMMLAEAQHTLTEQQLRYSVSEVFDEKAPAGAVIGQKPEAGTIVKEQRQITLIVSKGQELALVPDLRGVLQQNAATQLQKLGLRLGQVVEQDDSTKTPGTILSQNPQPGSQLAKGAAVDVVVVKAQAKAIVVPDFRGLTLNEVKIKLGALKLVLGEVSEVYNSAYPSGSVSDQKPAPGREAKEGDSVQLTVSKPESEQAKQGVVEFVVPDGPNPQQVQVVVTDAKNRRTVYENANKPGDRVRVSVDGVGSLRVQFYSNGRVVDEKKL